jgi:hypothetical protein
MSNLTNSRGTTPASPGPAADAVFAALGASHDNDDSADRGSRALTPEVRRVVLTLMVIRLHSTVGTIQWVSTAYLLALAARARGQIGPRYLPSSPGASSDVVSLALPGGVGALML